jgi:hypothetical protein
MGALFTLIFRAALLLAASGLFSTAGAGLTLDVPASEVELLSQPPIPISSAADIPNTDSLSPEFLSFTIFAVLQSIVYAWAEPSIASVFEPRCADLLVLSIALSQRLIGVLRLLDNKMHQALEFTLGQLKVFSNK